jgi:hypothetical protein
MLEHEPRSTHHDDALETHALHAPEPATEVAAGHDQRVQQVPPAASFAELTGQPKIAEPGKTGEPPLANVDAMIEQLAHGMVAKELDDNDQRFLAANGYAAQPIIRGVHEFVMRTFLPTQAGKPPIVAFRGTVPSKVQTVIADLDPSGIGVYQFNPNRAVIDAQMLAASTHGPIISSGHSLGGALAQIAAATFPDRVGRIVTFQAPGVAKETAKKLEQYNAEHPDQAIESTHHRVKGDLVPLGGEALTPGVIHNHEMTGGSALSRNPLAKHTSMPLAQEELAQGHDVPIHGDHGSQETGEVSTEHDNTHKTQVIEKVRAGLGHLIFGVGNAVHNITH